MKNINILQKCGRGSFGRFLGVEIEITCKNMPLTYFSSIPFNQRH